MRRLCIYLTLPALLWPGMLAWAVPLLADRALQLDLVGSLEVSCGNRYVYQDYDMEHNGMLARSKLGITLRAPLGTGADAVAMYLNEFLTQGDAESAVQYLWAGVDGHGYGQLLFGRGDSSFYTMVGTTDIFEFIESRGHDYYNAMGDQRSGMIMYALSALGNDLRLHYQSSKDNSASALLSPSYSLGFSVANRLGGDLTLAYGLEWNSYNYDTPAMQEAAQEYFQGFIAYEYPATAQVRIDKVLMYGAALSYGVLGEGLYLSLVYTNSDYTHIQHHLETYDVVGAYTFAGGMRLALGFLTQRYDHINVLSDLSLGIYYDPQPGFRLYAEALLSLSGHSDLFYLSSRNMEEHQYLCGMKFSF